MEFVIEFAIGSRHRVTACLAVVFFAIACTASGALGRALADETPDEVPAWARETDRAASLHQRLQQRAREQTRALVSSVLDLQLRQLSENGLEGIDLYRDVRDMRRHLNGLVESEMGRVIRLFVDAERSRGQEQDKLWNDARRLVHDIVIRLSLERGTLLRRLQAAEMGAEVERLIRRQAQLATSTESLERLEAQARELATVRAVEEQRGVRVLFEGLVQLLESLSRREGSVGAGALDGLRILRAAAVGKALRRAEAELESFEVQGAVLAQREAVEGLRLLLHKVEETQGLVDEGLEQAFESLAEILAEQRALRDLTRGVELGPRAADRLVQEQRQLMDSLARWNVERGARLASSGAALSRALDGGAAVVQHLFELDRDAAVHAQDRIIEDLAFVEEQLEQALERSAAQVSSARLAESRDVLGKLRKRLDEFRERLRTWRVEQPEDREALVDLLEPTERELGELVEASQPFSVVQSRLLAARDATAAAREAASGGRSVDQPLDAVELALVEAVAEIHVALSDRSREESALRVAEFSRAAEALDRAESAQRGVGARIQHARRAVDAPNWTPSAIDGAARKSLLAEQGAIGAVVEEVARSVEATHSDLAASMRALGDLSGRIDEELRQIGGADSVPTGERLATAESLADEAAEGLDRAAARLRDAALGVARELETQTRAALAELDAVDRHIVELGTEGLDPSVAAVRARQAAVEAARVDAGASSALREIVRGRRAVPEARVDPPTNGAARTPTAAELSDAGTLDPQAATESESREPRAWADELRDRLEQARSSLRAREGRLRRNAELAGQLLDGLQGQARAAETLSGLRGRAEAAGTVTPEMLAEGQQAVEEYARGLVGVGRASGQLVQQESLADAGLRRALETASKLQASASNTLDGQENPGDGASAQSRASSDMGTGLVPASPEVSGRRLAGARMARAVAGSAAAGGLAAAKNAGSVRGPGDGSSSGDGGDSAGGGRQADATLTPSGSSGLAPWMANLPRSVRLQILSRSRRAAPREYAERLRQYFEDIE